MRTFSQPFLEHLQTGMTTLCYCWHLVRQDGVVLAFTDLDKELVFLGLTHEPNSGLTASVAEQNIQLNVDNMEVAGFLDSDSIDPADVAAGLFDQATINVFWVNYEDPTMFHLMSQCTIGDITTQGINFIFSLNGLSQALQQPQGRLFQRDCDAVLGDGRCTKDITTPTYKGNGTIVSTTGIMYVASGLSAFDDGWFSNGVMHFASGAKSRVKLHISNGTMSTLVTWDVLSVPPAPGDTFYVTAGCDKAIKTCNDKFSNRANHRGFQLMPGNDATMQYPVVGSSANTGLSLFQ